MAYSLTDRHEAHVAASGSFSGATQGGLLPPLPQPSSFQPQSQTYLTALPPSAGGHNNSSRSSGVGTPRSANSPTVPFSPQLASPSRISGSAGSAGSTGIGGADAATNDDPQQLPQEQLPAPPPEQQQQQTTSPYYQAFNYGGVGLAAAAQAAHEAQQAALRKQVQRDIKRMLAGNRAYQHHVNGPPALSADSLAQLAQPKLRYGSRADPQLVANIPDPVEWARWKTDQLVISRLTEERRQAELAEEKLVTDEQLTRFRQFKLEAKQAKAEAKAQLAAQDAVYRASMSAYLNHKGAVDLEDFKRRKEGERERLALMRSRQVKGLAASQHY